MNVAPSLGGLTCLIADKLQIRNNTFVSIFKKKVTNLVAPEVIAWSMLCMDERATIGDLQRRLAAAEAALGEKADLEAALLHSEHLRRLAIDGGRMGTWRWNLEQGLIWGDAAFLESWGFPPSSGPRRLADFTQRMSHQGRTEIDEMECRDPGADAEFDGQFSVVEGPTLGRWVQWRGRTEHEHPSIVSGVSFDVTVRRLGDERLRTSEEQLQALFAASPVPLLVLAPDASDFTITAANDAYLTATRTKRDSLIGRRLFDVFADDLSRPGLHGSEALTQSLARVLASRRADTMERVRYDLGTPEQGFEPHWWLAINAPLLDAAGNISAIIHQVSRVTELHLAETAEKEYQARQAFLLRLSDALRLESTPDAIGILATRMLAEHMSVDRCYAARLSEAQGRGWVGPEWHAADMPPLLGEYRYIDFPASVRRLETEPLIITDLSCDASMSDRDKRSIEAMGMQAAMTFALPRGMRDRAWAFAVGCRCPRAWSNDDRILVEETADRTWAAMERAQAEEGLRQSEERFAQFAASSSDALWIRDATTLSMEYVSPAIEAIYGVAAETILGDVRRWTVLIVPDDRGIAMDHLVQACAGQAIVHEFRIRRPSDGTFRWIRNTDFPLHDPDGNVQRIGGIAKDVTDAKLDAEHSAVLLAELQHRVRNTIAMVRAMTARTGEWAESVTDYAEAMGGRLLTLARVQALLTRAANMGAPIGDVIRDELAAQAGHEEQFSIDGPNLVLAPKSVELLTLAIHELTTNALKYGALATPSGHVTVHWATFETGRDLWLRFDWTERAAHSQPPPDPSVPRRRGFGSELVEERIPFELGGRGEIVVGSGGAHCHLEFPLREGGSILDTGAPQRAKVYEGLIDMAGGNDLSGRRILVVEDDYYLATDAARALQGAGAAVLGPFATESAARNEINEQRPDAAVVDINLGSGASFTLAASLQDRDIPFIFTTGYDSEIIPAAFDRVERLQKPLQLRQIVGAVSKLLS